MATTPVYYPDSGGPSGFLLVDWADPQTYIAWCSYVMSENIKRMEEAGLEWADAVPTEGSADLEAAWAQQDAILSDLESQFYAVGDTLEQKITALPSESQISDLLSFFVEGGLQLFGGWLISQVASIAGGPLTAILLPLTTSALSSLLASYTSGQSKVETFTGMIIDLLAMSPSTSGYLQRAQQITTLTSAVSGIIEEVAQVEGQSMVDANAMLPVIDALNKLNASFQITYNPELHEGMEPIDGEEGDGEITQKVSLIQVLAEWQKVQALSEKIVQCPTTGRYIYTKSIPERSEEE